MREETLRQACERLGVPYELLTDKQIHMPTVNRSSKTGKFVTPKYAKKHKATTETERVKPQLEYAYCQVQATFKEWKGKPTHFIFMMEDNGKGVREIIKDAVEFIKATGSHKRRTLYSITFDTHVKL